MATRCRSPTESCIGRWLRRWARPTCSISDSGALDTLPAAQGRLEHGNLHVLHRGQRAQHMERLEDKADLPGAVLVSINPGQGLAAEVDLALGRPVETAEQMQERALAAPAGTDDRHGLVARHLQDTPQCLDFAVGIGLGQPPGTEQRTWLDRVFIHGASASLGSSDAARTAG